MFRNFKDPKYKEWRTAVYKRDGFKCQWPHCNLKKRLNAHHIKNWANYPGLRFEISNGITLCKYHHDMIKGMEEQFAASFMRIVANHEK